MLQVLRLVVEHTFTVFPVLGVGTPTAARAKLAEEENGAEISTSAMEQAGMVDADTAIIGRADANGRDLDGIIRRRHR